MVDPSEEPSPELLLWGLSRENYRRMRDWLLDHPYNYGDGAAHYEQFAETLNNSGVPPLDGEDNWTVFHLELIRAAAIRHARDIERRIEFEKVIANVYSTLMQEQPENDGALADTITSRTNTVEKWDNEAVAARVLAEMLDGTPTRRDVQCGPDSDGIHDYDICLSDGRIVALEITQEADSESRQQTDYIQKHQLTIKDLQYGWSVELDHRCNARPAYQSMSEVLGRLEELGIPYLSVFGCKRPVPFVEKLKQLGIRSVRRNGGSVDHGEVRIVPHLGPGWRSHSDAMREVVDSALRRKAEKLRRANADERHLWIWIDFTLDPILLSELYLVDFLPFAVPSMSEGRIGERVDVVWVAVAAVTEGHTTAVLKCDGNAWSRVELSEDTHGIIADAIQRSTSR